MQTIKKYFSGIFLCLIIAVASWFLGQLFPIIGGPVIAILTGMVIVLIFKRHEKLQAGINFSAKYILQYAVILLGFGMNLSVVLETGLRSLPIIISTIATSLIAAYILHKLLHIPRKISVLVGVGSSICGGSAIAATAPVIDADDGEVAQAISVIFLFNVLAAMIFPTLGSLLGLSNEAFGIFAGTAINDTSSVTAAASTWDALHGLGSATLDLAVTVKLTRTLAIIPITLSLAFYRTLKKGDAGQNKSKVNFRKIFPFFILWFVLAAILTTVATNLGVSSTIFLPFKTLSKFFIVMAMGGIGLNTDIVKLVKTGGKPLLMGFICWISITVVSLAIQYSVGLW